MSTTAVYYPRAKSIHFYSNGIVCGGVFGRIAGQKFWSLLKAGKMPRISLRKRVKITL